MRKVTAIAATVAAAASVMVGVAGPASADPDNLPILHAGSQDQAHSCVVAGTSNGYQVVVCSDIITGMATTYSYYAQARAEVYCQKPSGVTVVCGAAEGDFALESGAGLVSKTVGVCVNGTSSPCSGGRNYYYGNKYTYSLTAGNCATSLTSSNQIYNVVFSGIVTSEGAAEGTSATAALNMYDAEVPLKANLNTGHYFVCP